MGEPGVAQRLAPSGCRTGANLLEANEVGLLTRHGAGLLGQEARATGDVPAQELQLHRRNVRPGAVVFRARGLRGGESGKGDSVTLGKALTPTAGDLWAPNFGTAPAFALGVEEELLLVGEDNELVDRSVEVLREADPDEGDVTGELFQAMVESRSEISANATEAVGALRSVRGELVAAGTRIMGVGVHPERADGGGGHLSARGGTTRSRTR